MDDFPKATPAPPPAPAPKKMTPEEKQFDACKKVISRLSDKKYFGVVKFTEVLFPSVLEKLEANGFEVAYSDYYVSKAGHQVSVTITDPGLRSKAVQEQKNVFSAFQGDVTFGGGQDLTEGLTTLLKAFTGGAPPSNVTTYPF